MTDAERSSLSDALAGRYLIEREVGRGAAATVYLAQDLRHGRRVALKVLHSELGAALGVERFQREIRTQARLQHPHILPLFDSGSAAGRLFCTMPYVEGGSLRDRLRRDGQLPVDTAAQLAAEVASALTYAHALGVIHRDIKPENILISGSGHALLTDFGIAFAIEDGSGHARPSRITESGITLGTPTYMSPEQSVGDETVDSRSDIYSLAVVVYETLSGAPPFSGPNPRAIMARRLVERPPSLDIARPGLPATAVAAVERALARQPADRFETASDFAVALCGRAEDGAGVAEAMPSARQPWGRRVGLVALAVVLLVGAVVVGPRVLRRGAAAPAAATGPRMIVVLPFKNLGDSADAYFADGLTEELTSRLASLTGLRVISRTSAEQYRASTQSLKAIGAELGAGYVLEGSVHLDRGGQGGGVGGARVRVRPRLIAVADDSQLWSEPYEVELTQVFRVQSEIAEAVTRELDVALRAPEREALAAAGTSDPGGVRLLPPRQRLPRAQQPARGPRERGATLPAGGRSGSALRGRMGQARAVPQPDLLALLRPDPGPPRPREGGAGLRGAPGSDAAPRPTWRRGSTPTGAASTSRAPSASSKPRCACSRAAANCSRRWDTWTGAAAGGRNRSPASWRRCATIPAPASATSTWATTTCLCICSTRPTTTWSGR